MAFFLMRRTSGKACACRSKTQPTHSSSGSHRTRSALRALRTWFSIEVAPPSSCRRATRPRSRRCAPGWTASPWPSSWPRPGARRWAPLSWPRGWRAIPGCWHPVRRERPPLTLRTGHADQVAGTWGRAAGVKAVRPARDGTGRWRRWSRGAMTCSPGRARRRAGGARRRRARRVRPGVPADRPAVTIRARDASPGSQPRRRCGRHAGLADHRDRGGRRDCRRCRGGACRPGVVRPARAGRDGSLNRWLTGRGAADSPSARPRGRVALPRGARSTTTQPG